MHIYPFLCFLDQKREYGEKRALQWEVIKLTLETLTEVRIVRGAGSSIYLLSFVSIVREAANDR